MRIPLQERQECNSQDGHTFPAGSVAPGNSKSGVAFIPSSSCRLSEGTHNSWKGVGCLSMYNNGYTSPMFFVQYGKGQ